MFFPYEGYRSVTPLDAARIIKTKNKTKQTKTKNKKHTLYITNTTLRTSSLARTAFYLKIFSALSSLSTDCSIFYGEDNPLLCWRYTSKYMIEGVEQVWVWCLGVFVAGHAFIFFKV